MHRLTEHHRSPLSDWPQSMFALASIKQSSASDVAERASAGHSRQRGGNEQMVLASSVRDTISGAPQSHEQRLKGQAKTALPAYWG